MSAPREVLETLAFMAVGLCGALHERHGLTPKVEESARGLMEAYDPEVHPDNEEGDRRVVKALGWLTSQLEAVGRGLAYEMGRRMGAEYRALPVVASHIGFAASRDFLTRYGQTDEAVAAFRDWLEAISRGEWFDSRGAKEPQS